MSGPWEKYQAVQAEGPWTKYAKPEAPAETSIVDDIKQGIGNVAAGAIRGAGSIGATILAPIDAAARAVGIENSVIGRNDRRESMDSALQSMGAEPDSWLYKGSKLGAEVAGTAGAGGALANVVRKVAPAAVMASPVAQRAVESIATSGLRTGVPAATTAAGKAADLGIRALGGAATGAASAGMVNPEDAGLGAAIGGGFPLAATAVGTASRGLGRAMRGGEVAPEVRSLADRAKELGINVPADRLVNSKPMNAVAASLNYVPFSGRAATEEAMSSQLNQALSRTFGQDSSNVTMALRKAEDALGGQFDDFLRKNTVRVDQQFVQDLAEAANQAAQELGSDGANIISKQIDEILAKAAGGEIDGQAAYNIKRTLDRIGKRNSPEAWYALDLKRKLMDVLDRSVGQDKAQAFSGLRKQYGNMLELQKLAANGVDGEVSIARIANMKNIRNPEMQELADIAAQFLKPREGQHGAMQRAFAGMAAGSLGGIPALAGGAALGRGANMALNSNLARNVVLGNANPAVENALSALMPLTYKAAPVISAQ